MTAAAKTTSDGLAVVQLLVEKGANVNLKNKDGDTALHLAAEQGKTEVALLLLNSGAEVDPCNEDEHVDFRFVFCSYPLLFWEGGLVVETLGLFGDVI